MNTSTYITRKKPVCLVHPWDRRRIARHLRQRAKLRLCVGVTVILSAEVALIANPPVWVSLASIVAIVAAAGIVARAWFLASTAAKYDI